MAGTVFNVGGGYDGVNKFLPNVAGYYQVNWLVTINQNSGINQSGQTLQSSLWKNGVGSGSSAAGAQNGYPNATVTTAPSVGGSAVVYLNGTTDYLQVGIFSSVAPALSTRSDPTVQWTHFSAALIRGA
jgi:hypothetical protein